MFAECYGVCNPTANPNTRWTDGCFFSVGSTNRIVGFVRVFEPCPTAPLIELGNECSAFVTDGWGGTIVEQNITTI